MQVGFMAPQGWKGEFDGWQAASAWARTIELAEQAEALGFESLWVFDHFHTVPDPTDEITFESFSVLAALAMATERVRLGHMVVCTGFRNPALTAKLTSTLDVISGGRFELGIGAGWKEDEWRAYGYGFPTIGERMAAFGDHLEVITPDARPGPGDLRGRVRPGPRRRSTSRRASRAHIPIIIGGNGERRDRRLRRQVRATSSTSSTSSRTRSPRAWPRSGPAARPRAAIPRRCGSRSTSATSRCAMRAPARVDLLGRLAEIGLDRVVCFPTRWSPTLEAQAAFVDDCRAAGLPLEPAATAVTA